MTPASNQTLLPADHVQAESQTAEMPKYLDPSPLGTKEYWSTLYTADLETRQNTISSHTGTTWFDDANAEQKTVSYLLSLTKPSQKGNLSLTSTSFLDLGTGNGSLLRVLRKHGWTGPMIGIDYADSSIQLASQIWTDTVQHGWRRTSDSSASSNNNNSEEEEQEETPPTKPSTNPIDFYTLDILSLSPSSSPLPSWTPAAGGFDIVLDKGTFDAVSLSSETDPRTGRRAVESYALAASRFLRKPHGRMVVTSCNWTESELEKWFCGDQTQLRVCDRVPYRTFRFGGREGSVVVGLVFGWK